MKKHTCLYFILLAFLVCNSCHKALRNGPTTVNGKVLNAADNSPIANARILLMRDESSRKVLVLAYLDTAFTDENGFYSLSFKAAYGKEYLFSASVDANIYDNYNREAHAVIRNGVNMNVDLKFKPWGYVSIHPLKVNQYASKDVISISAVGNPSQKYWANEPRFPIFKAHGNEDFTFEWEITRETGTKESHTETVYCKQFDTVTYEFKY